MHSGGRRVGSSGTVLATRPSHSRPRWPHFLSCGGAWQPGGSRTHSRPAVSEPDGRSARSADLAMQLVGGRPAPHGGTERTAQASENEERIFHAADRLCGGESRFEPNPQAARFHRCAPSLFLQGPDRCKELFELHGSLRVGCCAEHSVPCEYRPVNLPQRLFLADFRRSAAWSCQPDVLKSAVRRMTLFVGFQSTDSRSIDDATHPVSSFGVVSSSRSIGHSSSA